MSRIRRLIMLGGPAVLLTVFMLLSSTPAISQHESPATAAVPEESRGTKFDAIEKEEVPVDSSNLITAATYAFSSAAGVAMDDMSSGTTQLLGANLDDDASAVTNLGFDLWFDGVRMSQFSCNVNGLCRFGPTIVTTTFTNSLASVTAAPKVAPFWDDLCTGANGKVHYKLTGSPGSRKLTVEWLNVKITRSGNCTAPVVGNGSFQMWLFESTGVIQFVYPAIAATTADTGYSIGLQSGVATNFASVTTLDNSVSYTVANNAQMTAIAAGTSYLFTPAVPAAPTGLNFTGVSPVAITVNWSDNATNEVGYAIYRSTDGTNFSFLTQTAAGATSFGDTILSPATTYHYRVYAVSEGAQSSVLAGSQATTTPTNRTANAVTGNWSNPATWSGGVVPTSSDNVFIPNGATITLDTDASVISITVGAASLAEKMEGDLGSNAILQFEETTARTLNVAFDVTVIAGSTLRSNLAGTQTGHSLVIGRNLTNNGGLDLSTNSNTAGAGLTFNFPYPALYSGTGSNDIRTMTVNKGNSVEATLELTASSFTVQGSSADSATANYLTLTNGMFKLGGTFTGDFRTFAVAAYSIPATAGFWLNNPNYTVSGQNGSPTLAGQLRISQGTFNIGTSSGNSMGFSAGSNIRVEGGAVNATGRFGVAAAGNAITYNQTGGTVTVQTIGQNSTALAGFDMGTSTLSFVTITGGSIIVQTANTAATTPRDYRHQSGSATTSNGTSGVTGGVVQLGNSLTAAVQAFNIQGVLPNLVLTNNGGNHTATWGAVANWNHISRNITISTGTTMNFGNQVFLMNGATLTNNGTLTHNGAASRFIWFLAGLPQNYTGTGTVTVPMTSFEAQNGNVVIDGSVSGIATNRVIIFAGDIIGANKLTIGSGGATAATIQFGNTSAGAATAAGAFDSAPTFNPGTGGVVMSYLRTTTARTTGFEIPPSRTLQTMTYDDNDPTHSLTIAGGNLTVTSTMTLANGIVNTGANTLTHNGAVTRTNGFVNGTLNRSFAITGAYTYHVGSGGYSPVAANITALTTNPSTLSVKPTDNFLPGLAAATAVSRFWSLTETGDLTADLTFTYLTADVNGTEANYKVWRRSGGSTTEVSPSVINEANNTAAVTGVTTFSDWGIGEALAPMVAFATIDGRVSNSNGDGVPLAVVVLSNSGGIVQTALTNGFGNFEFDNIATGVSYTVTVSRKGYSFTPPSHTFTLTDNTAGINFSGTAARPGRSELKD